MSVDNLRDMMLAARYECLDSLHSFIQLHWHIVEPKQPFVDGWHIRAICEHLEAVTRGDIRNLIISVPPRHMKSTAVAVMWPAWVWLRHPSKRWIFASYSAGLSVRDSIKCRRVIESAIYRDTFDLTWRLASDQNQKTRFNNDKTGYRIATSVGGSGTGEGGDFIVCFPYEAMLNTSLGKIQIGKIVEDRIDCKILSVNHETNSLEWKEIEAYEQNKGRQLLEVSFTNGAVLEMTEEHPVYVVGKGYIQAKDLVVGDEATEENDYLPCVQEGILQGSSTFKKRTYISSIKKSSLPLYVYNLRIKDNHNYFANGILVHNCDDPMKATEAESEVQRQNVIDWWDNEMSTRGNNPDTFAKVIIMQRLHQKDLAGHCTAQGGYEVLRLPAEYDEKPSITSIGWQDPRTVRGELLWPERFTRATLEKLKIPLGSRGVASQLQQDPRASEGGLFKRKWWKFYTQLPAKGQWIRIVQFWDTAQKPGISNDNSVGATWVETPNGYYLADLFKGKLEYPQLKANIKNYSAKWNPSAIVIEDKSSGISLIQDLRQETTLPIIAFQVGQRDKQVRAAAATPAVEAGNCFLPEGLNWVEDFIREHEQFPDGDFDDIVDTTSMMVDYFSKSSNYNPRVRTL